MLTIDLGPEKVEKFVCYNREFVITKFHCNTLFHFNHSVCFNVHFQAAVAGLLLVETVYGEGVIRDHIPVESAPDSGRTFKLFTPECDIIGGDVFGGITDDPICNI